jgi:hypothetical protein
VLPLPGEHCTPELQQDLTNSVRISLHRGHCLIDRGFEPNAFNNPRSDQGGHSTNQLGDIESIDSMVNRPASNCEKSRISLFTASKLLVGAAREGERVGRHPRVPFGDPALSAKNRLRES